MKAIGTLGTEAGPADVAAASPIIADRTPVNGGPPDWLDRILRNEPFGARAKLCGFSFRGVERPDFVVSVPVRNEIERLPRMLTALRAAMGRSDRAGLAVFAVNNTSDGSAALIEQFLARHAMAGVVVQVDLAADIRNAPHTRRLALEIAAHHAPLGALFTTDADSEVGPEWINRGLQLLAEGNDLVCEDVRLDDAGLAALPPQVKLVGEAERAYYTACDRLWRQWSGETRAFAYRASGASLAISSPVYRMLGGLPVPKHGEDGALCALVLANGGTVAMIADGGTRTSARLDGRAAGGCGEALSKRARQDDPECDIALVPLVELRRLALFRRTFGVRDDTAECRLPLRYSDVLRELAEANALLSEGAIV